MYQLSVQNLTISRNGHTIVNEISLDIVKGEKLLITGRNGAGKTTLIKAVAGLLPVDAGSVLINGQGLSGPGGRRLRSRFGYVKQGNTEIDFPVSSEEIVAIGLAGHSRGHKKQLVADAMSRTGCAHLRHRAFSQLSGGEKQRVSLARCICQEADILLLDEPFSFLDKKSQEVVYELVTGLNREGRTILMVSHQLEIGDWSGWRVLELHEGRLRAGTVPVAGADGSSAINGSGGGPDSGGPRTGVVPAADKGCCGGSASGDSGGGPRAGTAPNPAAEDPRHV